jgi:hypothetical protein
VIAEVPVPEVSFDRRAIPAGAVEAFWLAPDGIARRSKETSGTGTSAITWLIPASLWWLLFGKG